MKNLETAYFGGGCFWCVEAAYQRIKGVEHVESGYAGGGGADSPTYESHGNHAEVIKIDFNPSVINYDKLLEIFWHIHNPTTLNRQGNDVGPSYRSIILTTSSEQQTAALKSKSEVAAKLWDDPIVTEVKPLDSFTKAEDYHQNYYNNNPSNPYCSIVINPKIEKLEKAFKDYLK